MLIKASYYFESMKLIIRYGNCIYNTIYDSEYDYKL